MSAHGVDIAPGPLDRVTEEDAAAAARLHQAIDGAQAPIDRFGGVPAVARPPGQRDLFAGRGEAHHLPHVVAHPVVCAADLGGGFGQAKLGERVLGEARTVAQVHPHLRLLAKGVERAERHTDGRGRDRVRKDGAKRQPVERPVIEFLAGVAQMKRIEVGVRAIFGHERVFDHDILAARAAEAGHVPIVVDLIVAARDQKHPGVGRRAVFDRRGNAAERCPLAIIAAAGERPAAAQPKSAINPLDRAGRRQRGRDLDAVVFAPDVLLSLRRKQRQMPVVHADHAEDPAARSADCRGFDDRLIEGLRIELIAAPALWLDAAKQAGLLEVVEGLVRQPPQFLCIGCPLAQYRQQIAHSLEVCFWCHRAVAPILVIPAKAGNHLSRAS